MSSVPIEPRRRRRAALLWAGPSALLSHRSGGAVWTFDAVEDAKVELTVENGHPRHDDVRVHRSTVLKPTDTRWVDGLRVTSPALTVIDLAGVLGSEDLEVAFESARRMRLTTVEEVRARLDPIAGRGRKGATELRALLDALEGTTPAEYTLEVKVARLLRGSSLPPPLRQHPIRLFGRSYRLDFAWPDVRVVLECDGRKWHTENFARDRARWSALAGAGWRIVFVTWRDATSGWAGVEEKLRGALAAAA